MPITETQFYEISGACDRLLRRPEATIEWIAIPWLHVLYPHPVHLAWYEDLLPGSGRVLRKGFFPEYGRYAKRDLAHFVRTGKWRSPAHDLGSFGRTVDVLILSWLVNADHLDQEEDFYFGKIQAALAERGLSSLLLLRNQTRFPSAWLSGRGWRGGNCGRMILPDTGGGLWIRCLRQWNRFAAALREASSPLERRIIHRARIEALSAGTIRNLRLHRQVRLLCRDLRPSMVMGLYEGHAWEHCAWHGARTASGGAILCVGYQHTTFRKHHHGLCRTIGAGKQCDPDVILTLGEATRRGLKASPRLRDVQVIAYGSHRRTPEPDLGPGPCSGSVFLVIPEGILSECEHLFNFALKCARRLPDARFIFRMHPVLAFEKVKKKLEDYQPPPPNVEVSGNRSIQDDFDRSSYVIYRGSSAVFYAVLSGLKPFYISRPPEMDIDPLHELSGWRERVDVGSVEDFIKRYRAHQSRPMESYLEEWRAARDYCSAYSLPVREQAIDELMEAARRRGVKILKEKTCHTQISI